MTGTMECIGVDDRHELITFEMPVPRPSETEVLISTHRVGICATDREIIRTGAIVKMPHDSPRLVLGHEACGTVVRTGKNAGGVEEGDIVVPIVSAGRNRGVDSHGYLRPWFVEQPIDLVRLPHEMADIAVLLEPLTVTVEAFRRANSLRSVIGGIDLLSSPHAMSQRILVVGCGPIGVLGALLARSWGYEVTAVDVVGGVRKNILEAAGCSFVDVYNRSPAETVSMLHEMDIIVSAAGDPEIPMNYLPALGRGGVVSLVGWNGGVSESTVDMAKLFRDVIHRDQALVGSVGANAEDFEIAAQQLRKMHGLIGGELRKLISAVYRPWEYREAFDRDDPQDLVVALEFGSNGCLPAQQSSL